ncbi:MAG: hypothetical protein AVDCRST_MAG64-2021 [uncultured Phycisphaerae bacterium]|uniref:Uncharacterized protein n=1 Tax=uncultured Phycisphaerae bacterium TaxID=904963 RepID=A0A6J4P5A2_9BACT|nr:MAG: hypothetical protein AVDCRST_MAG64-2021 [uncultured Phycisphaerae bacterium]
MAYGSAPTGGGCCRDGGGEPRAGRGGRDDEGRGGGGLGLGGVLTGPAHSSRRRVWTLSSTFMKLM